MNFANHFAPIEALDLDPIKVKLMHKESGEGWTRAYADEVEFEYRRFLYLMKTFPHEQAAPLFDVDVFWHYHILDTMKYAADCDAVFGYFLHHFPYVGLRGEDDLEFHRTVGDRMRDLYAQTFGREITYRATPACARAENTTSYRSDDAGSGLPPSVAWSIAPGNMAWSVLTGPSALAGRAFPQSRPTLSGTAV
ncbi:MAG: glycine-rich domain-containing protein-like [Telluria sp.]